MSESGAWTLTCDLYPSVHDYVYLKNNGTIVHASPKPINTLLSHQLQIKKLLFVFAGFLCSRISATNAANAEFQQRTYEPYELYFLSTIKDIKSETFSLKRKENILHNKAKNKPKPLLTCSMHSEAFSLQEISFSCSLFSPSSYTHSVNYFPRTDI